MELFLIVFVTIFASGIGTLTGFGTSTIMVPILLFFVPLPQTLLLVGIIHWFGNVWKILLFKEGVRWKLIATFGAPGIIAAFIGARIVISAPEVLLSKILGGFLIAYTLFLFLDPRFSAKGGPASGWKLPVNNMTAATGGALSGFFAGIFGVGGAIRGAFLTVFDLPKAIYIATAGVIGLAIDSTRLATYLWNGTRLDSMLFWGLIIFVPASFLGAFFAKRVVDKISQRKFRTIVIIFLTLIGIKFLFFP